MASASGAAKSINDVAEGLKPSIVALDQVTKQIDPQTVGRVMANVDKFSTTLGENTDDINTIVANVTELSKTLNASAARIDGILTRVNGVVAGANDQGMFAEITEAAKSVRVLANQLNSSTASIASGLNNFTSQGLSQYSALAVEARNTLSRLDKVVRNLEQNPQSLVFGGDTVREYNKR
jgi:phospholipid/cholesterol/gamma-HCH transport system substrate-binding protein